MRKRNDKNLVGWIDGEERAIEDQAKAQGSKGWNTHRVKIRNPKSETNSKKWNFKTFQPSPNGRVCGFRIRIWDLFQFSSFGFLI
jgi:hypothetical protein